MISVSHLIKRYGARLAVDDVSFRVDKGDVVGFLGPNGAGKSTTLRILSGFLGMTSGVVEIHGHDIKTDSFAARACIGYMPEAVPLYPEMRVVEFLTFRAELKQVPAKKRRAWIDDAMDQASVAQVANHLIGTLSKGFRQRVGLADALVSKPPILILDEPTSGLDPNQIREVRKVICDLRLEHTILLSTHILSEVEASCDRVIVIDKGKLVAQGKTEDLQRMQRPIALEIEFRGNRDRAAAALGRIANIACIERVTRSAIEENSVESIRCFWDENASQEDRDVRTEEAISVLVHEGIYVRSARALGSSLEEVFAELTGGPDTVSKNARTAVKAEAQA